MSVQLTLRDIAEAAGVSEMTVSRALRNSSDVSEKTRLRIQEIAAKMGYVPNKIASALASQNVDLVGVIIPSVRSLIFGQVLDGISHSLAPSPLRPVFGITNYDPDVEIQVIQDMLSWRPSGLIVTGLEHSDLARTILENTNVPVVEIMDVDGDPIQTAIGISHIEAGYAMGKAIIEKGHKKIAVMRSKADLDYRVQKRMDGFTRALDEAGIPLITSQSYSQGSSIGKGREMAEILLSDHRDLDCIYCSTDVLAVGAYMYCMAQGIDVPSDLGLAGFSNLNMLQGLPKQITTTDSKRYEIGQKAADFILKQLELPNPQPAGTIKLSSEVVWGETL